MRLVYCMLTNIVHDDPDLIVEIQEVTKTILLSAIGRMSKADIASLVKYWSAFCESLTHSIWT